VTPYVHPIGGRPPDSAAHPRQADYPICCRHIQRRDGRPTCRKPGWKSLRWPGKLGQIRPGGASNLTGRSKGEPGKPRKRAARETDRGSVGSAEPFRSRRRPRRRRATGQRRCPNSPGSERTACQDGMVVKARNHARVASALPHSEGIASKPPCGEVAMGRRVGRMGPVPRGRTGTAEPGPERGPLGRRVTHPPRRCILMVGDPAQYGTTALTLRCTKGDGKPGVSRGMPGAGLSL
jgi:hypothetical protein